jgi:hypothetical protein
MQRVSRQLGQPGAGRAGGNPKDVYTPGGVLDDEEGIQPVQGDGVEMEHVAGEDRVCLGPQEVGP